MADQAVQVAFDPTGKTFNQRLDACLSDAAKKYSITIRKDTGRTAEWQQKLHIAHMFLYTKYATTTPADTEPGKRTIEWSHLSDPKTLWNTVNFTEILRTKTGAAPGKVGNAWAKGSEPDRAKTEARAAQLLQSEGIGNNGQAMVSSGLKPCGEPCSCGAGRSKHLDGLAADLNSNDLTQLETKLKQAKAGTVDDYLKKFGLHRPLLNHPSSPEKWHVEALP